MYRQLAVYAIRQADGLPHDHMCTRMHACVHTYFFPSYFVLFACLLVLSLSLIHSHPLTHIHTYLQTAAGMIMLVFFMFHVLSKGRKVSMCSALFQGVDRTLLQPRVFGVSCDLHRVQCQFSGSYMVYYEGMRAGSRLE